MAPILGADIELGNAWVGRGSRRDNLAAAMLVLREVAEARAYGGCCAGPGAASACGEWGRVWLSNGGCIYIDMSHIEICVPETAAAHDHAAAVHALLRIVRACRRRAAARLAEGEDLFVNLHNSDGTLATSWGAHTNAAISRKLWDDLFLPNRPHTTALLASFVAAAAPVFGQGLVLPLPGGGCRYTTSARAHHIGHLVTLSTTEPFHRGLLNCRDEPHARDETARLHLIAFDANLQPAAIVMRSGLLQLVVAALELGWFDPGLLLDDPVAALHVWAAGFCPHTGCLRPATVRRAGTQAIGLFDWHRRLLDALRGLVEYDLIPESIVPGRQAILDLWSDTLDALIAADSGRLNARLDWSLKWSILRELPTCTGQLDDPRLRLLDQHYGHVDDKIGLFWPFWKAGLVERAGVTDADIGRFITQGDPHTRSSLRGELVRRLGPRIVAIDWSHVELMARRSLRRHRITLSDPAQPGAPAVADLRRRYLRDEDLLDFLVEAAAQNPAGSPFDAPAAQSALPWQNCPRSPNGAAQPNERP